MFSSLNGSGQLKYQSPLTNYSNIDQLTSTLESDLIIKITKGEISIGVSD